jgi:hypothetical protein
VKECLTAERQKKLGFPTPFDCLKANIGWLVYGGAGNRKVAGMRCHEKDDAKDAVQKMQQRLEVRSRKPKGKRSSFCMRYIKHL